MMSLKRLWHRSVLVYTFFCVLGSGGIDEKAVAISWF